LAVFIGNLQGYLLGFITWLEVKKKKRLERPDFEAKVGAFQN
jgi:hypothetical protein